MFTIYAYSPSGQQEKLESLEEAVAFLQRKEGFLWMDYSPLLPEEANQLKLLFSFHPLALEDALKANQRPKVEEYPGFLFAILYSAHTEKAFHLRFTEVACFIGPHYVVTCHSPNTLERKEIETRFETAIHMIGCSVGAFLYTLTDYLIDSFFPCMDALSEWIEDTGNQVLSGDGHSSLKKLFNLRKILAEFRRIAGGNREAINSLMRYDLLYEFPHTLQYMQDVYDHIVRIVEGIDVFRDNLIGAMDTYLSLTNNRLTEISNRLNMIMKTLTAASIILMTVNIIPSLYGMNFARIPGSQWEYGFFYILGSMLFLTTVGLIIFKRKGWL